MWRARNLFHIWSMLNIRYEVHVCICGALWRSSSVYLSCQNLLRSSFYMGFGTHFEDNCILLIITHLVLFISWSHMKWISHWSIRAYSEVSSVRWNNDSPRVVINTGHSIMQSPRLTDELQHCTPEAFVHCTHFYYNFAHWSLGLVLSSLLESTCVNLK